MKPLYRPEPLIPATRKTAITNFALLRTQASAKGYRFTSNEAMAAMRAAVHLESVVRKHARKRTAL